MIARDVEVLRAACCVAGLDGDVDANERALLTTMAKRIGVGEVSLNAMINRAQKDPKFFEQQFKVLSADPEETLRVLLIIAMADNKITTEERVVLNYLADKLGMTKERFDELLEQATAKLKSE